MIGDIHVEFQCAKCGEKESVKVDYWFSVDGSPQLQMETGRDRLERYGWTFEEREGKFESWHTKFINRCNDCTCRAMKVEIAKED